MNKRGQASIELMVVVPIFVVLIGGTLSAVYIGWQNLKVQQAANVAARIQGQERVGGGKSFDSIEKVNGQGETGDTYYGNDAETGQENRPSNDSVYGRLYKVAKDGFFKKEESSHVRIPKPLIGQNVDEVTVVRFLKLPEIPFLKRKLNTVRLEGQAWGGEDTYMYGLPRWGDTGTSSGGTKEWQRLMEESKNNPD